MSVRRGSPLGHSEGSNRLDLYVLLKKKKKNGMSKVSDVKTAESLREKYLCLIFGKTDKKHTKI